MVIRVDIDNTICHTEGEDYPHAVPIPSRISKINSLFDQGHEIIYWTARGVGSGIDWRSVTEDQLKNWGAKYNKLELTKPIFDLFIDDKAKSSEEWFKS